MNYIQFSLKKFLRKLGLNHKSEIANFPFSGDNIIGYDDPIVFSDEANKTYYSRYYQEHLADCHEINSSYHLQNNHLFKIEILECSKINSNEFFSFVANEDCLLPLSGTKKKFQEIKIFKNESSKLLKINTQRYTYIKIKKGEKIKILSTSDFLVGKTILLKRDNKNKYKLVLLMFVDGLYDLENLGLGKISELMPNTTKFFENGTSFRKHHANAEWTLASFPNIFTGGYTSGHGFFHPRKNHEIGRGYKGLGQLFHDKNYLTFQVGGGWRMNPSYGYIKGFDRTIYKREMDCNTIITEFIENNQALGDRDQFVWLNFNELHHFLKSTPSIISQLELGYDHLIEKKDKKTKSVFSSYDETKIKILRTEMKRLDTHLNVLYQYIDMHYNNNETLISLVTDHGHGFLDKSNHILSKARNHIPWYIRGGGIPEGECFDFTENVDIFRTIVEKCELDCEHILNDGNLPVCLGGVNKRDYVFAQSIYPGQPYKIVLKDDEYEFYFQTRSNVQECGSFVINPYDAKLISKNSTEIVENKDLFGKYEKICLEHANRWLQKI